MNPSRSHRRGERTVRATVSALAVKSPRRWLLVILTLIPLALTALVFSGVVASRSEVARKHNEDELRLRGDMLRAAEDDIDSSFAETEKTIDELVWDIGYRDKLLSRTALSVLQNGSRFFGRYIDREFSASQTAITRPKAYQKLGEINEWLGLMTRSEAAYRESRRLLQELKGESANRDTQLMLAATSNSLGCLLATTGREEEAERILSEAIEQLEHLLAEDPSESTARFQLCYASRNLGLIHAMLGRDGTQDVRRSLAHTSWCISQFPGEITVEEYLIDSYQILVQLLWRQGDFSHAVATGRQSIQEIDGLVRRYRAITASDGRIVNTLKYHKASAMALANNARLQGDPAEERPSANSWQWRPLHRRPGWLIHADVLVRGSLAGEFERQDAFLMAWLDEEFGKEPLVKMIAGIYQHANVIIMVEDELIEECAKTVLRAAGVPGDRVQFCQVPTNTIWVRDYGPLVVDTGDGTYQNVALRAAINFQDLRLENSRVSVTLSRLYDTPVVPAPLIMAGGEILSNGKGLCLVSKRTLNKNLHAGYPESHVTNTIKRVLGATEVIYLEPLQGERTGHVDWFATFTAPDTVVIGDYRGNDPANSRLLDQHAKRLEGVTTPNGPLKVVRIPMPPRGQRSFGGTYTNVVFANGILLVPSCRYTPPELEREAFDVYRRLLPDWKIVGIDCTELFEREGALRCATINLYRFGPSRATGFAASQGLPLMTPRAGS